MEEELLYRIALTQVPELGPVHARLLVEHFGSATAIFKARKKDLGRIEGIGEVRARQLLQWNQFACAEKEMAFLQKHQVRPLFLSDPAYPQRLLNCYDAPILLYYRGQANLNQAKIISVVGTRQHSPYGKWVTEQLLASLQPLQPLIISGLALGIDAIAHRTALQLQLPTIGVMAHGLGTIYPAQHRALAKDMLQQGGLITEFGHAEPPDKHNFPRRNRIVAGLSDATVVIETAVKGGSMITAELAGNYHRDVFAVPGKISDARSAGCLRLIYQNKATLLTGGEQLMEMMGWNEPKKQPVKAQKELFLELTDEEKKILAFLHAGPQVLHFNDICSNSGLSHSNTTAALLNLELQQVIRALPGNRYQLLA